MRLHHGIVVVCLSVLAGLPGASLASAQTRLTSFLVWDLPTFSDTDSWKYFDCGTNDGADELVLYVEPPASDGVIALHARIYLHWFRYVWPPPQPHLPEFWQLQPGACRAGAYSVSTDFSAERFRSLMDFEDRMQGRPAYASFVFPVAPDSECGALNIDIPFPEPVDLLSSKFLLVCRIALPHVKSVGVGACPGCCVAMDFASSVGYSEPGRPWTWPAYDQNDAISTVVLSPHDEYLCPTTSARSRTWGEVKTLYR